MASATPPRAARASPPARRRARSTTSESVSQRSERARRPYRARASGPPDPGEPRWPGRRRSVRRRRDRARASKGPTRSVAPGRRPAGGRRGEPGEQVGRVRNHGVGSGGRLELGQHDVLGAGGMSTIAQSGAMRATSASPGCAKAAPTAAHVDLRPAASDRRGRPTSRIAAAPPLVGVDDGQRPAGLDLERGPEAFVSAATPAGVGSASCHERSLFPRGRRRASARRSPGRDWPRTAPRTSCRRAPTRPVPMRGRRRTPQRRSASPT